MKNYSSVFIGIVDILGYKNAEQCIDKFGEQASSVILGGVYERLDQITTPFTINGIHWIRYGDGYVIYSESNDIEHLSNMIKNASKLIAFSFKQSIPLRVAITQGDIKINNSKTAGITITGSGWNTLLKLEKALDWMGGWLYLSSYDNNHHQMILDLVSTTHLILQQNNCSEQKYNFTAPFKGGNKYSKGKSWFINWHKVLHQQNQDNEMLINNWWLPYTHTNINNHPEILSKQNNTKAFAHYCNHLYQSIKLAYFSNVAPDIKISEIMN